MVESDEFFFEFKPELFDLSKDVVGELTDLLFDSLVKIKETPEIEGIAIIKYDGSQILVFSSEESNYEKIKLVGEVIASLEPVVYFKDLTNEFEYRGIGHIPLEDYDLFIVKIDEDLLLIMMSSDPTSTLFQVGQNISNALCNVIRPEIINKVEKSEIDQSIIPETVIKSKTQKPIKQKEKTKTDLKNELRSKLDGLK